jgi:predicted ATPase/class 3 adenylate cyclase
MCRASSFLGFPPGLDSVVRRALSKSPQARYRSAGALSNAANEAVTGRPAALPMARKTRTLPTGTVTFLFTDVEGSTRLLHELGAEAYAAELEEHRRLIREACTPQGGVEVDTQGDAFFFAFASAPGALEAARTITEGLTAGPIQVRIGVHTGTPHVTSEGYVGEDVHRAARIAASAHGGQVVVSGATASLLPEERSLTSLGSHRLKDIPEPIALFQLGENAFAPLKTIANTNLPAPASSFLGREGELYEADLLLRESRLFTITGPGGAGKTRFALELARRAREERFRNYEDGVFSCFLASLRDPALVLPTIAQTLSVREQPGLTALDTLSSQLQGKKLLLLLDNLEHLLACAHELAELLQSCPGLSLLLTSRELLRLDGERPYDLPPLAEAEGVALLCERARVAPSDAIRELCARLEGLPLALELAAARLRLLSPEQLLERLSGRLDLLKARRDADPRQQTLRATIQWSHDLLSVEEQALFARLSVFVGGCTLEAAEAVCDADLDALESLLDKSLLRRAATEAGHRFWMLETIREFAADLLKGSGKKDEVGQRHAEYCVALATPAAKGLESTESDRWLAKLEHELDNLRAALVWVQQTGQTSMQLELVVSTRIFWYARGRSFEGRLWTEGALSRSRGERSKLRAQALNAAAEFSCELGDQVAAQAYAEESLSILRERADSDDTAPVLNTLGRLAGERGEFAKAERLFEEAAVRGREAGDRFYVAAATANLGNLAMVRGDYRRAIELTEESLVLRREPGGVGVGLALHNLAVCYLFTARMEDARTAARESLAVSRASGDFSMLPWILALIGSVAARRGDAEVGARLIGAADAMRERTGVSFASPEAELHDCTVGELRGTLGQERYGAVFTEGQAMSLDEAISYALESSR